jgi:hypothetical protein
MTYLVSFDIYKYCMFKIIINWDKELPSKGPTENVKRLTCFNIVFCYSANLYSELFECSPSDPPNK